ncbi:hypothetical protein OKW21_000514 [Catalinimonas alkaloidigena]|uniref:hypothetical protein n=1 Tax=Catalinimonas alkaloidigena TaxID=1075417 RepID=UPI0024068996|nr:hypothetical protein [Catalinimonas alkaloidigena]MDF9795251.1 hypothetical protein [Catalinimonas alkaloidigena]
MHAQEDLNFLRFFLTEPIYLVPEAEPPIIAQKAGAAEAEGIVETETVQQMAVQDKEESKAAPAARPAAPLPIPETEGGNHKGVVVLFYDQKNRSLGKEERGFLGNILKAVKLNFDDVALCNWALLEAEFEQRKNIFESIQHVECNTILAFGQLPLSWSLSHFFQKYHITEDAEGRKLLLADDLLSIAQNRDFKVQLWNALKKMFQ